MNPLEKNPMRKENRKIELGKRKIRSVSLNRVKNTSIPLVKSRNQLLNSQSCLNRGIPNTILSYAIFSTLV